MAVSDQDVKALYTCDGVNDTFAIPSAIIPNDASAMIKVYLILISTGVLTLQTEGGGADYVLDPPFDATSNPGGPTQVIFNTPPTNLNQVLVIRASEFEQTTTFLQVGNFNPKSMETGLDKLLLMIQEVGEKVGRTILLPFTALPTTNTLTTIAPLQVPRWNEDGDAWEMVDVATLLSSIPGGGGVPPGGVAGDFIEKLSGDDGDADWQSGSYDGFSLLTGAAFTSTGLKDTLDKIIRITYTAPLISLSASGSGTVREKGDSVASTNLSATITKRSDPIANVRFYQGATLLDTQTGNPPVPDGGSAGYTYSTPFSDNISFSSQTIDDGATGGPTNVTSNTVNFTFVYPYYYGSGAAALSAAGVAALTKDIRVSTASLLRSFTPNGSQVLYFAYPASYGALTTILDENGFNTFPSWTLRTENITGLDASAVSYRIYEYNNTPVAGTYPFTFIR